MDIRKPSSGFAAVSAAHWVERGVAAFRHHATEDIHRVADALVADGVAEPLARALIAFLPLAFGRVILRGLGVRLSDSYQRADATGKLVGGGRLLDEPLYAMALAFAERAADRDLLVNVGGRSAEVIAINDALHAGSDPADLVAAPPIVLDVAAAAPDTLRSASAAR